MSGDCELVEGRSSVLSCNMWTDSVFCRDLISPGNIFCKRSDVSRTLWGNRVCKHHQPDARSCYSFQVRHASIQLQWDLSYLHCAS